MIATLRESKARLSELVQIASRGEEVLITVHGKPRAKLVPVGGRAGAISAWLEELALLRAGQEVGPESMPCLDVVREDRW